MQLYFVTIFNWTFVFARNAQKSKVSYIDNQNYNILKHPIGQPNNWPSYFLMTEITSATLQWTWLERPKVQHERYLSTYLSQCKATPPSLWNQATKECWILQFVQCLNQYLVQWCITINPVVHRWRVWNDNKNFIQNNFIQDKYQN